MSRKTLLEALNACQGNKAELARQVGVSHQQIHQWLKNKWGAPSWHADVVAKVAKGPRK